jgi:hypothetical protein
MGHLLSTHQCVPQNRGWKPSGGGSKDPDVRTRSPRPRAWHFPCVRKKRQMRHVGSVVRPKVSSCRATHLASTGLRASPAASQLCLRWPAALPTRRGTILKARKNRTLVPALRARVRRPTVAQARPLQGERLAGPAERVGSAHRASPGAAVPRMRGQTTRVLAPVAATRQPLVAHPMERSPM